MADLLSDFKDLLEAYFLIKNAPEPRRRQAVARDSKKDKLDDVKIEIYDSYLNKDFERNSNVSSAGSKVMKEFFMEVDKFEKKYMNSAQITSSEMAKESNGHALACGIEFTQNFKRFVLLDDEIREELLRASKKKSKKKKSKKRKTKKLRKLREKSRIKGSKRKQIYHRTKRKMNGGSGMNLPDITLYRRFYHNGKISEKEISISELAIMNSDRIGGWPEPTTIEKIRNYYLSQERIESCDVEIIITLNGKLRSINNNDCPISYGRLSVIPFINLKYWNKLGSIHIIFNIGIDGITDAGLEAEFEKLEK